MELSSNEASALYLGHSWGLITRSAIRDIADKLIEAADGHPSSEICELAVCKRDFQVNEVLSSFLREFEKWPPVVLLVKKYLDLSSLEKSERYSLYYSVSNYADWDDPEPWRTIKIRCHELSDARQEIWDEHSLKEEQSIASEIQGLLVSL